MIAEIITIIIVIIFLFFGGKSHIPHKSEISRAPIIADTLAQPESAPIMADTLAQPESAPIIADTLARTSRAKSVHFSPRAEVRTFNINNGTIVAQYARAT
jgi:hypothetical protein